MNNTLILVDGSSFLFRAFHALPPLTNSAGEPTGAILGVTNMLRKMVDQYPTPYLVIVFDAPGKTFRDELYPEYKSHRPPMPDELRAQIEPLHDLVRAMGLSIVMEVGVEADDVIGTLAKTAEQEGFEVIISTGDKDMAQLVNDHIILENTMSDTRMDSQGVEQKFGVKPEQIIDYLALVGDAADNIPGVPKVGPKTASKWLQQYGTLKAIMENADAVKGKVGENLRAHLEQLPLSRQLTTIKCDVPIECGLSDLKKKEPDIPTLVTLLKRFEFSSWLKQIQDASGQPDTDKQHSPESLGHYDTVFTQEDFEVWLARLEQSYIFCFDTETTSLNYTDAEIVGVSFSVIPGEAAYVPVAHDYIDAPVQLDREYVLERLRPLLEDASRAKVGQNLKYDANVLHNYGIELRGIVHDTMLESYVLDSTATRHDMDSMALKFLGKQTIHFEDVAGKGAKQILFSQVPLEQAAPYAAEDADITLQLHQHLWPQFESQQPLTKLYREMEVPLIPVLSRMECNGVLIDAGMLSDLSRELAERIIEIEEQTFELAGKKFNLGSPKQIQAILYDDLGLPVLKKTPKGQPSTAETVLQELALDYPLPKLILEHRGISKLKSTYSDSLPLQVNAKTGRVHTSYHQAVAATGRLSSTNPNLQNIPVRSEDGRKIRQAFIPPKGHKIVAADYSQIELRIMAHLSGDEGLLKAFNEGVDIHSATASEVFETPLSAVSKDQRRSAKAINFGLIYGMSAFGLARQLGVKRGEAQTYIDLYFSRYPGVKQYMDETRKRGRDQGYVETLFGRRLYLPEINSRNVQRRQYAERTAINAPMQGTAADIIKRAMIKMDTWVQNHSESVKMIMQVHDELVFEVENELLDFVVDNIRTLMTGAASLKIPLLVDIGVGSNWDEAH